MRAWIANTDLEWYRFLAGRPDLDEVNFWRPSGGAFQQHCSRSGRELRVPGRESARPDPALLDWHNRYRFLG